MPDEQITQSVADPIPADPIAVPPVDGDMTTTTDLSPDRERDGQGRFVSADPLATEAQTTGDQATTPVPDKFSPQMMDQARAVQLTDDQIGSFDDPALLYDVILGRQSQMAPPPQQTQQQAPAGQATGYSPQREPVVRSPEPLLEDFTLELNDDEVAPELAKPVKALAEHVNKLKAGLVKQVNELRAQNAEMQAGIRDSAAKAQVATTQQQAGMWDQIAESIPGMVDAIGKPSIAMVQVGSNNANAWGELAPFIAARAQSQRVPEHLIDYSRAAREGWTAYRAVNENGNGQSSGNNPNSLPGVAVRSASRTTAAPSVQQQELTPTQDHDQRDAFMKAAWQAAGGNPFI